jgi:hypothetical protein
MFARAICGLILLLQTTICTAQERLVPLPTPKRPTAQPAVPKFIIAVYMQPPDMFDVWRTRGINTLVGYESRSGTISNKQWSDAAAVKGFYFLRKPADDLEADAKDPNLLAWTHDDEPDVKKPPTDPKHLQEEYAQWKQAAPKMPVFVNFSGGSVLGGKVQKESYLQYLKAADWVGSDFYPVTGYNRPDWLWKIGAAGDTLRDWSEHKPQFAFIETSAQRLPWTPKTTRGVSVGELRAEIWHAVIHGVRGIVYFPQQIGEGFKYDATPPRVALEMSLQNKRLAELGEALAAEQNPAAWSAKAEAPLEIGWRVSGGKLYVIALNFSDAPVRGIVTIAAGQAGDAQAIWEARPAQIEAGRINEAFEPYQVKVYRMGVPAAR